jgi:predicted transcriptional regulator
VEHGVYEITDKGRQALDDYAKIIKVLTASDIDLQ